MNATTFDSLAAARKLKDVGVEGNQAEAIAEAIREGSMANREDFVTKTDLAAFETRLKTEIAAMGAEMATMANRIIVTLLVAMGVLFIALAALKLF